MKENIFESLAENVNIMLKGLDQMSKHVRNTLQVRVSETGSITLPKGWMKQHDINPGDIMTLVDLNDGVIVMRPRGSRFEEVAGKLAKEWEDSGVSLESMLNTLHEVRAELDHKTS